MMRIPHIPSSLKGFRTCPKRWRYQQDAPPDDRPELRFGTEIHLARERYFKEGIIPNGPAAVGLEDLPPAGCAKGGQVLVEHQWSIPAGPVLIFGTIDLVDLRDLKRPVVGDHKTSSSIDRYGLRPSEIAVDPQLNCYAYYVLHALAPTANLILLQHHYLEKGDIPKSSVSEALVTRDHVEAQWEGIVASVRQMASYRVLGPDEVTGNPSACTEYGGCRFIDKCPVAVGGW